MYMGTCGPLSVPGLKASAPLRTLALHLALEPLFIRAQIVLSSIDLHRAMLLPYELDKIGAGERGGPRTEDRAMFDMCVGTLRV